MADMRRRIAMARQRFGNLRHLWNHNNHHQNLRLRLYRASVCSILTYGSEAWRLTAEVFRATMVSVITGKSPHLEASAKWRAFDLVRWVRARRLQWAGHILRFQGRTRILKHAVF